MAEPQVITKTFSEAGNSNLLTLKRGQTYTYAVDYSADFDGGLFLEYTDNGGLSYTIVRTFAVGYKTDVSTVTISDAPAGAYRFRCITAGGALTGTAAVTLTEITPTVSDVVSTDNASLLKISDKQVETVLRKEQKYTINVGAKAGATAGWVVGAGDDKALLATCPQSQTASTLVIPVSGLKVGWTITAFHLVGQIDSAGNGVTLDASLRKLTVAVAGHSDASVGAITQVSVTADTALSSANTTKSGLTEVVGADETFYLLLTATTGATTDIEIQGACIVVTET